MTQPTARGATTTTTTTTGNLLREPRPRRAARNRRRHAPERRGEPRPAGRGDGLGRHGPRRLGPQRRPRRPDGAVKLPRPDKLRAAAQHSPTRLDQLLADFEREALVWCHLWPHPCLVAAEGLQRLRTLADLPVLGSSTPPAARCATAAPCPRTPVAAGRSRRRRPSPGRA